MLIMFEWVHFEAEIEKNTIMLIMFEWVHFEEEQKVTFVIHQLYTTSSCDTLYYTLTDRHELIYRHDIFFSYPTVD